MGVAVVFRGLENLKLDGSRLRRAKKKRQDKKKNVKAEQIDASKDVV